MSDNSTSEGFDYTPPPEMTTDGKKGNPCLDICSFCSVVYLSVIFQAFFHVFTGYYQVSSNATILDFLETIVIIIVLGGFLVWWVIIKKRKWG